MRCILSVDSAGQLDSSDALSGSRTGKEVTTMNVPLVRQQLRSAEMLDAVRIHRQGGWPVALDTENLLKALGVVSRERMQAWFEFNFLVRILSNSKTNKVTSNSFSEQIHLIAVGLSYKKGKAKKELISSVIAACSIVLLEENVIQEGAGVAF